MITDDYWSTLGVPAEYKREENSHEFNGHNTWKSISIRLKEDGFNGKVLKQNHLFLFHYLLTEILIIIYISVILLSIEDRNNTMPVNPYLLVHSEACTIAMVDTRVIQIQSNRCLKTTNGKSTIWTFFTGGL